MVVGVMCVLQLFLGVLNNEYTLQDFIDFISSKIENNHIKSHLQTYLQKTQELEELYSLINQYCSPRFTIQSGNNEQDENGEPFIFHYFIRKIPNFNHYCLYISIPANHPLHGKSYDEVPDATFASFDEEDQSRWVFGWDYAHFSMLTLANIYMYYDANPLALLDMQIITKDIIEEDVARYLHILEGHQ